MPLSLVILEGLTPATAKPILATHDPVILEVVRRLLLERLSQRDRSPHTNKRQAANESTTRE